MDDNLRAIPGSNFLLPCDLVIRAIGQSSLAALLAQAPGVALRNGAIAVDRATGQTGNPKYYAGGDCVNGGREVVDAAADGKRAGRAMAKMLDSQHG
jgi:NADPH-dependent glutamate synthase beta chain and related oxidoreductases